jgi:hypothetical protein
MKAILKGMFSSFGLAYLNPRLLPLANPHGRYL